MSRLRIVLLGLTCLLGLVFTLKQPVNCHTLEQIRDQLLPPRVDRRGIIFIGGSKRYTEPYYGDTWFTRFQILKQMLVPPQVLPPDPRHMTVSPRIIITEEEEAILLGQ